MKSKKPHYPKSIRHRRMKSLLLLNISIFFLVSCSNEIIENSELVERQGKAYKINSEKPFTGDAVTYHKNGQVSLTTSYKNGLMEGIKNEFYDNGQLLSSVNYFMGLKEGIENVYYFSGELHLKKMYKNGNLTDERRFDKEGAEVFYMFVDDSYAFTSKSDLTEITKIIEDYETGIQTEDWSYVRVLGNKPVTGKIVTYADNGSISYEGFLTNGEENGIFKYYNEDGNLSFYENYSDGLVNGIARFYENYPEEYEESCWQKNIEVDMSVCVTE